MAEMPHRPSIEICPAALTTICGLAVAGTATHAGLYRPKLCCWAAPECQMANRGIALLGLKENFDWLCRDGLGAEQCLSAGIYQEGIRSQCR